MFAALIGLIIAFGFVFLSACLDGWALSVLWGWFIVPIFGLPVLTQVQALGVALVMGFMTKQYTQTDKDRNWEGVGYAFVKPIFAVIMGWVILQFM